mgnify:CR=1 FL=1
MVSIHGLLRALTDQYRNAGSAISFNPRALTSPDAFVPAFPRYEQSFNPRALTSPDSAKYATHDRHISFNPRALTSPDFCHVCHLVALQVSIHGLLRALTYFFWQAVQTCEVSIHGLLRALTRRARQYGRITSFNPRALTSPDVFFGFTFIICLFQSTGSYEP